MKTSINAVFFVFISMTSISYGQSFECDNNFGDCGTPNQSGGGGGGGGSVLIANTDLGDTYQNADDYDDDGIEDSSDNCLRIPNADQTNSDGDLWGDACDNCIYVWNDQQNLDGDNLGDWCDDDIDGDGLKNTIDDCPFNWGNDYCFNIDNIDLEQENNQDNNFINSTLTSQDKTKNPVLVETEDPMIFRTNSCSSTFYYTSINNILILILSIAYSIRKANFI